MNKLIVIEEYDPKEGEILITNYTNEQLAVGAKVRIWTPTHPVFNAIIIDNSELVNNILKYYKLIKITKQLKTKLKSAAKTWGLKYNKNTIVKYAPHKDFECEEHDDLCVVVYHNGYYYTMDNW